MHGGRARAALRAVIPEHVKITYALVDYLRCINHAELNTLRYIITLQPERRTFYDIFTRVPVSSFSGGIRSPRTRVRARYTIQKYEIYSFGNRRVILLADARRSSLQFLYTIKWSLRKKERAAKQAFLTQSAVHTQHLLYRKSRILYTWSLRGLCLIKFRNYLSRAPFSLIPLSRDAVVWWMYIACVNSV